MLKIFLVFLVLFGQAAIGADPRVAVAVKINAVRRSHGLSELKPNELLSEAAQSQSDWMSAKGVMEHLREEAGSFEEFRICNYHPMNRTINSGYFSFEDLFRVVANPDGTTAVLALPHANDSVGEIIAKAVGPGSDDVYDPNVMVRGWMNSPGHRKEILKAKHRDFGVGFSSPRYGETYWCVVFASSNL